MSSSQINNKRIAKNTLFLYLRTLFVMVISLYTSRVVLQVLGVEDYGIYQVVGGLVAMFSIISASLSASISRFITFEIGKGNKERRERVFSTSLIIQIVISLIVIIVAEAIGLWFLHNQMQIPEGRMVAAQWILHCSLITFCINLLSVPYNACLIAHEHMKTFAYVNIIDVLLKLGVVLVLTYSPVDKLIAYAVLLTIVAGIIRMIYTVYCHRHFEESRAKIIWDRQIFNEMAGFSGWAFFTNANSILNNQGVNMLINVFFGVTVNAARGIANQVESAVLQFVNNFTMAINPQITKSYAAGDLSGMHTLVCRGAKFSYFAMLIMALPIICETEKILSLWLTVVPKYTIIFVQLSLVLGMFDSMGASGYTACAATGKMRRYSLIITPIGLLEFPLTWVFFIYGAPVVSTYYLYIFVKALVIVARMFLLRDMVGLKLGMFIRKVFIPVILTTLVSIIPSLMILNLMDSSLTRLCISLIVGFISVGLSVLFVGMSSGERNAIMTKVSKFIKSHQ